MSIDEQINEAWKQYVNDMDEDVRQTVAFHSDVFAAGYRAALRGLWRVIPKSEVEFDMYYTIAVRPNHELLWRRGAAIWTESPNVVQIINSLERFDPADVELFLQPNLDDLPSPAEVFGEDTEQ